MFEYDAALKILLKGSAEMTIQAVSGLHITRWHDVELPRVEQPRVDLLGESDGGHLLHIELQSSNDLLMPLRMIEYGVKVARRYERYPRQVLLYVGESPLRMASEYAPNDDVLCRYRTVDFRDLDGEQLLHSSGMGDNVVAILARLGNQREAVRQIVERIANLDESSRQSTLEQLLILAGLRHLAPLVEEEAKRMPITENILDHEVLGREFKRGVVVGEANLARALIVEQFGSIPEWLDNRLRLSSPGDLEKLAVRILRAKSVEDLAG